MMAQTLSWDVPPVHPILGPDEVHVWLADLDVPEARARKLAEVLSHDERARARRFRFQRDRGRFAVGRGTLREILSGYVGQEPMRLAFTYGPRGKPMLTPGCGDGTLRFNLSHSEGFTVIAVARYKEVGVDIERVRPLPDFQEIADRCFSERECACLRGLPADQRSRAFFNFWTRKEAYVKALGDGLAQPLNSFEVSLMPSEPVRLVQVEGFPREVSRWTLWGLPAVPGSVGAAAAEGDVARSACWKWPTQGWSDKAWNLPSGTGFERTEECR